MTVDGPRDFLWQAVPLTDPATGEVTRAFAIYRDVSALRERERALERERDRLDEFASIVSHDLRNPLQVARSHLEIARDTGGEDHFDTIERSLRRMETLLEDLLVLAREDGTVDGTEPIDIAALVETCWREDIAGNGSLDLRTDRTVMAEQSRLRQLFSNLLGNAVEHGSTSPDSQARQDALEHGSPEQSVSRDCAAGPGVGEGEPPPGRLMASRSPSATSRAASTSPTTAPASPRTSANKSSRAATPRPRTERASGCPSSPKSPRPTAGRSTSLTPTGAAHASRSSASTWSNASNDRRTPPIDPLACQCMPNHQTANCCPTASIEMVL